jgi:hypothetical protein
MASEVERLPDLAGFVKIASRPDWHRVRLTPVAAPFVSRRPPRAVAEPPASEVTSASVSAPTPKQPMSAAKYAAKRPRKAKTPATGASDADAQQLPLGGSLPALNSDSSAVQHHGGGAESPP